MEKAVKSPLKASGEKGQARRAPLARGTCSLWWILLGYTMHHKEVEESGAYAARLE